VTVCFLEKKEHGKFNIHYHWSSPAVKAHLVGKLSFGEMEKWSQQELLLKSHQQLS
jgi:hypothetical protein